MNSTTQEQIDSYEETQSDSSIWASEHPSDHPCDSGEESDIDSYSEIEKDSLYSKDFEIFPPLVVEQAPSRDAAEKSRVVYINTRRQSPNRVDQLPPKSLKRMHVKVGMSLESKHSLQKVCGEEKPSDQSVVESVCVGAANVSAPLFAEVSSPERPFVRPPNATAKELIDIHRNYRRGAIKEWPLFLPPNMDEDVMNLEHPDPAKRPRYLPLAPPYHLLPNTSFFRRARIKPPPTYNSDGLAPLKRIINRYLASILVDHMKFEENLKLLIEERKKHFLIESNKKAEEFKESAETEFKSENRKHEEFSVENRWRQRKTPWVVVQHLHYGGKLIHYIQKGGDLPPTVPGYFTGVPLIPGNIKITRELNGDVTSEYQQQRTAHGFIYIPLLATELCIERGPSPTSSLYPCTTSQNILCEDDNKEEDVQSESEEEIADYEDIAQPCFAVETAGKYASISFIASTVSVKFAEDCLSLCRSPKHG